MIAHRVVINPILKCLRPNGHLAKRLLAAFTSIWRSNIRAAKKRSLIMFSLHLLIANLCLIIADFFQV